MRCAARRSALLAAGLLAAFGLPIGLAVAALLAASIFLDVLNVFLFFLEIFSGEERQPGSSEKRSG